MSSQIRPIADAEVIDRLRRLERRVVEPPWDLRPDVIASHEWVVVPVEKGRHFEIDDAARVSAAIRAGGSGACFAVSTESVDPEPCCYDVPPTAEALLELSDIFAGLNFALLPLELEWVVLCTSEDYNLYAGPESFVRACLGADVSTGRRRFRSVAVDPWWAEKMVPVADRYAGTGLDMPDAEPPQPSSHDS